MSNPLCQSLLENYAKTITLIAETIGQFDPDQWHRGINFFQVPAKIAYHVVDCLDYYFWEEPDEPYAWGHRFDGGWWELSKEDQPTPEAVLAYLDEIKARIVRHLAALDDEDLATPFDPAQEHGQTRLGHYTYALRHTMHHHGALSLLSLQFGNEEGRWL